MATEHYQRVNSSLHHDPRFMKLGDDGKLCFFLTFTHPNLTSLGAMRATTEGLAAEYDWTHPRLLKALRELCKSGLLEHDAAAKVVAFPDFFKHNPLVNANQCSGAWPMAHSLVPECDVKRRAVERALAHLESKSADFKRQVAGNVWSLFKAASPTASGTASPTPSSQEKEDDPEKEDDQEREGAGLSPQAEADEVLRGLARLSRWERSNMPGICEAVKAGRASEKQLDQLRGALRKVRSGGEAGYSVLHGEDQRAFSEHYQRRVKERGL